jgi:hypothetical protein
MTNTTIRHTTIACILFPPITDGPRLDGARHRSSHAELIREGSPQQSERSQPYSSPNTRLLAPRRPIPAGTGRAGDLGRFAQEFGGESMPVVEFFADGRAAEQRSVPTAQGCHELDRSPFLFEPNPVRSPDGSDPSSSISKSAVASNSSRSRSPACPSLIPLTATRPSSRGPKRSRSRPGADQRRLAGVCSLAARRSRLDAAGTDPNRPARQERSSPRVVAVPTPSAATRSLAWSRVCQGPRPRDRGAVDGMSGGLVG